MSPVILQVSLGGLGVRLIVLLDLNPAAGPYERRGTLLDPNSAIGVYEWHGAFAVERSSLYDRTVLRSHDRSHRVCAIIIRLTDVAPRCKLL